MFLSIQSIPCYRHCSCKVLQLRLHHRQLNKEQTLNYKAAGSSKFYIVTQPRANIEMNIKTRSYLHLICLTVLSVFLCVVATQTSRMMKLTTLTETLEDHRCKNERHYMSKGILQNNILYIILLHNSKHVIFILAFTKTAQTKNYTTT